MKTAKRYRLVLITAPDLKTARKLARRALRARLIACANLVPKIESHYRWRGKVERGMEVLLIMKTTAAHVVKLEKLILAAHPYDTPEFLVLLLHGGTPRYLDWLDQSCSAES
jgi:periplasmic divalent cation tolerance protein